MTGDSENSTESTDRPVRTVPLDADPDTFPQALAARIGDRELWIANGGAIESDHLSEMDLDPEHIVSVNRSETSATTHHHPLKDGYVNNQQKFTEAVETTREKIQTDGTVLVNCAAGISRSSTVIATAIAAEDGLPFEVAVEEIRNTRPRFDQRFGYAHKHTDACGLLTYQNPFLPAVLSIDLGQETCRDDHGERLETIEESRTSENTSISGEEMKACETK